MWNFLLRGLFNPGQEQITIPSFVNQKYSDILRHEEYDDFSFSVSYANSSEYDEGVVTSQNPVAGRPHNAPLQGRKISIELVVSSGEEPPQIMPDLIGIHYVDARNQLVGLNLDLTILDETITSEVDRGYVVETRPAGGGTVSRGNTVVIVRSEGLNPRRETVPDLRGSTKEALEAAFKSLELIPEFMYLPDDSPEGTVLVIARMGQEVEVPFTIIVHISTGPQVLPPPPTAETSEPPVSESPQPPVTESPSPSPSEDPSPPPVTESPSPDPSPDPPPTDDTGTDPYDTP